MSETGDYDIVHENFELLYLCLSRYIKFLEEVITYNKNIE